MKKYLSTGIIIIVFSVTRLLYIFNFPLFTDESTYIRWGQFMVSDQNRLWASLAGHGKQPLMFWIFGLVSNVFPNPAIASRTISVFFSVLTVIAVYYWIMRIYTKQIAQIAVIYITTSPLFIHFGSLAMMESATLYLTALVLWFTIEYIRSGKYIWLVLMGFVFGLGFWIKTTLIFTNLLAIFTISISKPKSIKYLIIPFSIALLIILPLIIQTDFNKVIADPGNFTYSLTDLSKFPLLSWAGNLVHFCIGMTVYAGPVFLTALGYALSRIKSDRILILWLLPMILIPLLFNRVMSTRYYLWVIIPALPIMSRLMTKKFPGIIFFSLNIILTVILLVNPKKFFALFPQNSVLTSERNYAYNWTAGYASRDAYRYLTHLLNPNQPVILSYPDIQGNPADYFMTYLYHHPKFIGVIMNSKADMDLIIRKAIDRPVYFISRSSVINPEFLPELSLIKSFTETDDPDFVGIYKVSY